MEAQINQYLRELREKGIEERVDRLESEASAFLQDSVKFDNFRQEIFEFLDRQSSDFERLGRQLDVGHLSNVNRFYGSYESASSVVVAHNRIVFPRSNSGWAQVYSEKFARDKNFYLRFRLQCPSQQIRKSGRIFLAVGLIAHADPSRESANFQSATTGNWIVLDSGQNQSRRKVTLQDGKRWGKDVFRRDQTEWILQGQVVADRFALQDSRNLCVIKNDYHFEDHQDWSLIISCFSAGSPTDFSITIL